MTKITLSNDHNVYVLGAGFSRAAGLPVLVGFFDQMRDTYDALSGARQGEEAKALAKVFDFYSSAASAAYRVDIDLENIEQLFCLASAAQPALLDSMKLALSATLDHARTRTSTARRLIVPNSIETQLCGLTKSGNQADVGGGYAAYDYDLYDWIVGQMVGTVHHSVGAARGTNTFISFNYDTLVEDALHRIGVRYTYGLKGNVLALGRNARASAHNVSGAVKILKIHGSMNWAVPGRVGHKATVYRDYQEVRQSNLVPELVPPTWQKDLAGRQAHIIEAAVQELHGATNIFVIGFSIPPTDTHFRYLLAAGLKGSVSLRRIVFVNPDVDGIKRQAQSILRRSMFESGSVQIGLNRDDGMIENFANTMCDYGRGFEQRHFFLRRA